MKKIKFGKKEKLIARYLVGRILQEQKKKHPKLKKVESNYIHILVNEVVKKCNLPLSGGWFKYGPYYPVVDDVLVELGMDPKEHQLYGDDNIIMKYCIECDCHKGGKEDAQRIHNKEDS
jgi:hypothetical protein